MTRRYRNAFLTVAALAAVPFVVSQASAIVAFGVEGNDPAPTAPPEGPPLERGECDEFINFDDSAEPCVFSDTAALRDKYAAQGVTFAGVGPRDGGGILDECGGFGVSGHSSPNFLAFNCNAGYPDGGAAAAPETMNFSAAVSSVSMLVASASGGQMMMTAYNGADVVDTASVNMAAVAQVIGVSGSGIDRVEFGSTATCVFIADDLCYTFGDPTPVEESSWGRIKSIHR